MFVEAVQSRTAPIVRFPAKKNSNLQRSEPRIPSSVRVAERPATNVPNRVHVTERPVTNVPNRVCVAERPATSIPNPLDYKHKSII